MSDKTVVHLLDFTPNDRRSFDIFLKLLVEKLGTTGWKTVFVFADEPAPDFAEALRILGASYLTVEFPLTRAGATRLVRDLAHHKPLVLQTAFVSPFTPNILWLRRKLGVRHWIVNDHSSGKGSPRQTALEVFLSRLRGAFYGRFIDYIVTVSDFLARRDIEEVHLPAGKVRTIHNGIDSDRYAPPATPPHNEPPIIAYAGQLIPEKGVSVLIEALRDLRSSGGPAFRLRLAGAGSQEQELRSLCLTQGLEDTEFLGQIDWIPDYFRQSDIVVVPSQWEEAFGLVVAEAMSCAACVVASDAGGIPEVIGPDDVAGTLFRRGNSAELKAKLTALLSDPENRRKIGLSARERVIEHFRVGQMVDAYAKLYDSFTDA